MAKAKSVARRITSKAWWSIILGGVAGIIFGLLAIFWPGVTLKTLVLMSGIFVVAMGLMGLAEAIVHAKTNRLWWLGMLSAVIVTAVGIFLLCNPETTIRIFMIILGLLIFGQALIDLVIASYSERKGYKWLWIIAGLLSIIFGLMALFYPIETSTALVWVLGVYALVHGILAVIFALRIRRTIRSSVK
jgi:uncharacterized membrane protein HdeD (DUF308 family)